MADIATFGATGAPEKNGGLMGVLKRIGKALIKASPHNRRLEHAARLHALSDEQLAKLGIPRDRIVHHVFSDIMHL
ncbi:DUF1127 domain-containing protein [Primorskyibacter flagellatus]|uniref:DUF1127 domain-containing protein n=1 Tax=Primorskyibacter flagellatus TaxID=1387277 RepID=A0A1W1ZQT1_9RHOB|nr:DUF1127 domain-containing protein [Primorskyibacter flagellatus]SMC50766.1 hypothetical protein SAMN06295998_10288 [Primorskyibacter flagellatus]